jgi:hypothetical protein
MESKIADDSEGGNFSMKAYRAISGVVLAATLAGISGAVAAARCEPGPGQRAAPAALAAYSAPAASAQSVIAANWMAFFDPKTPVDKRISLLQDGQQFAAVIRSQSSSALAAQASAKVTSVTLVSATRAKVVYTIVEGGRPALANQTGVAVYQDGTWKVGLASFCSLLAMENGGKTSSLPAVCTTAG